MDTSLYGQVVTVYSGEYVQLSHSLGMQIAYSSAVVALGSIG